MADQWWSWILSIIGLAGFFLAGKKVWWCWYVNIANQILWTVYAFMTEQWGFLAATAAYTFVFTKNAISWTKEHYSPSRRFTKAFREHPLGVIDRVSTDEEGVQVYGWLNVDLDPNEYPFSTEMGNPIDPVEHFSLPQIRETYIPKHRKENIHYYTTEMTPQEAHDQIRRIRHPGDC